MSSHGNTYSYESDSNSDIEDSRHLNQASPALNHQKDSPRPLIDSVRNAWQTRSNPSYDLLSSGTRADTEKHPHSVQMALTVVSAPRFRRYVVVYLSLFLLCLATWKWILYPRLQERNTLLRALDPATAEESGGWFGSSSPPALDGLILMKNLNPELIPDALGESDGQTKSRKRLVIVGDVHGCKDALLALLDQVEFSAKEGDHLIFTGDIINKGPDSSGVVDLAREKSASCVRGNHEDRILLLRHEMERTKALDGPQKGDKQIYSSKQLRERELARSLSKKQVEWLEQCPVILNIGRIPTMGQVVVVHGGLVPGLELEEQDPASVMTMRTIDVDTHLPSPESNGLSWAKMFDKHQSILFKSLQTAKEDPLSRTITAVYGHDAKTGLKIRTYTKGLDSGCVKGGKLTALVIEDGGKQSLVQVRCRDYTSG
ncbi:hypothetical protein N7468_003490 [Penicillium chermesinum]|uniref:Calcineurin-like phosphoesterase domain-containing protein n=1 Tax=Penicillium chermesinum TaxID=63820 RepID=A0A9W9P791_9EURO|nr:uncharacterized protein N7468_003490 [Penicillium chermesinum]KAJ5238871.1 hypothetical protein N7468_003490 [Penicillium chermesinum]